MNLKNTFSHLSKNFFIGLLLVVIGIAIIISPEYCKKAVIFLLGLEAVVNGIYSMIVTRKIITDSLFQYSMIFKGMLSIVVGLLAIFLSIFFDNVVTALIITLAVYFFIDTIIQIFASGKLREDPEARKKTVFEAVICCIVAIILCMILINAIIYIAGGVMLIIGLFMIVYDIKNRPIVAEKVEVVDDISGTIE